MHRAFVLCAGLFLPTNAAAQGLTHLVTAPQDATVLGKIGDVDAAASGHIYVLDTQASVVYVFSPDGSLEAQLGREGQGPGEIRLSNELEVGPDGQVLIADVQNRRLTMWSASAQLLGSRRTDALFGSGPAWSHDLVWNDAGIFVKMASFASDGPIEVYSVPADLEGRGEKLFSVPRGEGGPTCAFCTTTLDDEGRLFAAAGDTLYSILSLDEEGAVTGRWTRDDLPAVRYTQSELDRIDSAVERVPGAASLRSSGGFGAPQVLNRFGPHRIGVDTRGRLWVAPRVAEGQSGFFDIFAQDGQLLRTIELDVPFSMFRIRGDRLAVASETPLGEPVVRLYSIDPN